MNEIEIIAKIKEEEIKLLDIDLYGCQEFYN